MEFHPNDLSDLDDLTEEHLGFSALSDGLGFSRPKRKAPSSPAEPEKTEPGFTRPAAAEIARQRSFSGIGAVAAGPDMPAPGITKKAPAFSTAAAPAAQILAEPAAPRALRLGAFLLDALFILMPLSLAWFLSFGAAGRTIFFQDPKPPLALFAVIFGVYFLLSESFGGQSLGKMLLGLRVVEDDKYQKPTGFRHALARMALFLLGLLCLGLGFFASFWDAKRRPWHDRYSGSIVRRTA
jgi:uncharacterized RDD family membrane protein YckC